MVSDTIDSKTSLDSFLYNDSSYSQNPSTLKEKKKSNEQILHKPELLSEELLSALIYPRVQTWTERYNVQYILDN